MKKGYRETGIIKLESKDDNEGEKRLCQPIGTSILICQLSIDILLIFLTTSFERQKSANKVFQGCLKVSF